MPLGAARIALLAKSQVTAVAEVIRKKVGVAAIGNAQISTAQSKFGGSSLVCDGTGDYAFVDEITLGNEWTIEGWFRFDVTGRQHELFEFRETNNAPGVYYIASNNKLTIFDGGTTSSTNTISANTWYHIAFVSDPTGNTVKGYVNGTLWLTHVGANTVNAQYCYIGQDDAVTAGTGFDGNIDEIRFSTVQRYTSGFTAPTAAFTNDSDTALLLHFDGTDGSTVFVDDNGVRAPVGVGAFGNAQIDTAQSKFGSSSALFDGNGDYLLIDNYTGTPFAYGTGDFTIEMFIRFSAIAGSFPHIWDQRPVGTNGAFATIYLDPSSATIRYLVNGANRITATNTVTTGTWYHLAISRSGTSTKMFLDGTQTGSTYTDSTNYGTGDLFIGSWHSPGTEDHDGHIDEIRVSNIARYTANFTPSTVPFVNDDNTLLLLHMDGTDASTVFLDDNGENRSPVGLYAIDGAQIDTAQSKFGGASALFDGSNDVIRSGVYNNLQLHQTDFTIEGWIYTSDTVAEVVNYQDYNTNNGWAFGLRSNGRFMFVNSNGSTSLNVLLSSNNAYLNNTWTHFAAVYQYSTTTLKLYSNGTLVATNTSWSTPDPATVDGLRIGFGYGNSGGLFSDTVGNATWYAGHLDELRISNTARYTANFTPQTEPFQNDANTLLLMHMDGTDGSTVFVDDNGVEGVNEVLPVTLQSVQFQRTNNTTGERINHASLTTKPSDSYYSVVSAWVKLDTLPGSGEQYTMLGGSNIDDGNGMLLFEVYNTNIIRHYTHLRTTFRDMSYTYSSLQANTWVHVVAKNNYSGSGRSQMWINGVRVVDQAAQSQLYIPWSGNLRTGVGNLEQYTIGAFTSDSTNFSRHFNGCIGQLYFTTADVDLDQDISKFYNNGFVDFGPSGTASGLPTPVIYHNGGNQTDFATIRGSMGGTQTITGTLSGCE